ncbi:MAG: fibrobacter succinogenes major paralogous domain-containing protein, partial [Dysgonamonadaceae bacterium]|nr:fibrobacter succinogenes major paralogous domain-containing protein [Dysgonamonadaceae bacterium]
VYNTYEPTGAGIHFWDGDDWIKPCAPPAPEEITFSSTSFLAGVKYAAGVAPVAGATSYVWTLPPAFTVFGASDGATITFSAPAGTYSIDVRAKNACGESSRRVSTQQIAAITGCDALPSPPLITSANVEFVNNNAPLYTRNTVTLSTPVRIIGKGSKASIFSQSYSSVDYRDHPNPDYGSWFTWCMVALYGDILCPGEWRVPSREDFCKYANDDRTNTNDNSAIIGQAIGGSGGVDGWLLAGYALNSGTGSIGTLGTYWSSTEHSSTTGYRVDVTSSGFSPSNYNGRYAGASLRCVR